MTFKTKRHKSRYIEYEDIYLTKNKFNKLKRKNDFDFVKFSHGKWLVGKTHLFSSKVDMRDANSDEVKLFKEMKRVGLFGGGRITSYRWVSSNSQESDSHVAHPMVVPIG